MKTKVLFRMFQGSVVALFPRDVADTNPYHCSSYAHVGQHSTADPSLVINGSRPATPAEYKPLAKELRRVGYKLDIRQRTGQNDLDVRREYLQESVARD